MQTQHTNSQLTTDTANAAAWQRVADASKRYFEYGTLKNANSWGQAQYELALATGGSKNNANQQKRDVLRRCANERYRPEGCAQSEPLSITERSAIARHTHHVKPENDPADFFNYVAKPRKCCMCRQMFSSAHAGNRRCAPCDERVNNNSGAAQQFAEMYI